MKNLKEHIKTLAKYDDLVGIKVYDKTNDVFVYIKSVNDGLWCGKNINNDFGNYYNVNDLMIEIEN